MGGTEGEIEGCSEPASTTGTTTATTTTTPTTTTTTSTTTTTQVGSVVDERKVVAKEAGAKANHYQVQPDKKLSTQSADTNLDATVTEVFHSPLVSETAPPKLASKKKVKHSEGA